MLSDQQGGTLTERLIQARLNSIDISELMGVCKGVLADGKVNVKEATFIVHWLEDYSDVLELWPADILHRTLGKLLEDGALSAAEECELIDLLTEITGMPISVSFY